MNAHQVVLIILIICTISIFIIIISASHTKETHFYKNEENIDRAILALPNSTLCAKRQIHAKLYTNQFLFSWLISPPINLTLNWLDARNWCRLRCMDLISLEKKKKMLLMKKYMQYENIESAWTSGRLCDFSPKCFERADLQPLSQNGWFCSSSGAKLGPRSSKSALNDWVTRKNINGSEGAELSVNKKHEASCLAYLMMENKEIKWDEVSCESKKAFVCEDSPKLIKYAQVQ